MCSKFLHVQVFATPDHEKYYNIVALGYTAVLYQYAIVCARLSDLSRRGTPESGLCVVWQDVSVCVKL